MLSEKYGIVCKKANKELIDFSLESSGMNNTALAEDKSFYPVVIYSDGMPTELYDFDCCDLCKHRIFQLGGGPCHLLGYEEME